SCCRGPAGCSASSAPWPCSSWPGAGAAASGCGRCSAPPATPSVSPSPWSPCSAWTRSSPSPVSPAGAGRGGGRSRRCQGPATVSWTMAGPCGSPRAWWARGGFVGLLLADQLAQHVLQDAAVAVVVGLTGGVDAHHSVELDPGVGADLGGRGDAALVQLGHAGDGVGLLAGQAEGVRGLPLGELQRQHAHADQVRAVDALE